MLLIETCGETKRWVYKNNIQCMAELFLKNDISIFFLITLCY